MLTGKEVSQVLSQELQGLVKMHLHTKCLLCSLKLQIAYTLNMIFGTNCYNPAISQGRILKFVFKKKLGACLCLLSLFINSVCSDQAVFARSKYFGSICERYQLVLSFIFRFCSFEHDKNIEVLKLKKFTITSFL